MAETKWAVADIVTGEMQAELLRGLLEAQGIQVILNQEGAGRAIGLSVGPLGEVEILVPADQLGLAKQIFEDYYSGKFSEGDIDSAEPDSNQE